VEIEDLSRFFRSEAMTVVTEGPLGELGSSVRGQLVQDG
jgi:hypothetical protein